MIPNYRVRATFYVAASDPNDAIDVVRGLDAESVAAVFVEAVADHPLDADVDDQVIDLEVSPDEAEINALQALWDRSSE